MDAVRNQLTKGLCFLLILSLPTPVFSQDSCTAFLASLKMLDAAYTEHTRRTLTKDSGPITIHQMYEIADAFVAQNPEVIQSHMSAAGAWLKDSGNTTQRVKTDFLDTKGMEGLAITGGPGDLAGFARSVAGRKSGAVIYTPHMALKTGFGATVDKAKVLVYADADSVALGRPSPSMFHEDVHIDTDLLMEQQRESIFIGVLHSIDGKPMTQWAPGYPTGQRLDELMAYTESVARSAGEIVKDKDRADYWLMRTKHHATAGAQVTRQTYEVTARMLKPGPDDRIALNVGEMNGAVPGKKTVVVRMKINSSVGLEVYFNQPELVAIYAKAKAGDPVAPGKLQQQILAATATLNQISFEMNQAFGEVLKEAQTTQISDAASVERLSVLAAKPYEIGLPVSGLQR